jgi:ring-1,2-phenylacetyl-CoA epoxidase subunit PaaB
MDIFDVFQRRAQDDPLTPAGSIKAPDLEMALMLARETHFRHGEGVECWLKRRGDKDLHAVTHPETMGGVLDRSYRRQDGYVGVGAKHKQIATQLKERGMFIDAPRPKAEHHDGH